MGLAELQGEIAKRGLGAIVLSMHESPDPSFRWLSRGAAVTRGHLICAAGRDPVLVAYPMERDEAVSSGLEVRSAHEFGYPSVFAATSPVDGWCAFFETIFRTLDIDGPIAFAGFQPLHIYLPLVAALTRRGIAIDSGDGTDIVQLARRRKDASEIAAIGSVGARTESVVGVIRELLRGAAIRSGEAWSGCERLTIGRIKDEITLEITRRGMVEDHATIVSLGRDAAVPHSRGTRHDVVRESTSLVIDIFPRDAHSGYFFDLTRTFCIGTIPDALREMHALVADAHAAAVASSRAGVACAGLQRATCERFESAGWPTILNSPRTERGYVHGLGHGVGMEVHESPSFSMGGNNDAVLERGDVFTIEPGLYDVEAGLGVRIEDTLYIDDEGHAQYLSFSSRALEP